MDYNFKLVIRTLFQLSVLHILYAIFNKILCRIQAMLLNLFCSWFFFFSWDEVVAEDVEAGSSVAVVEAVPAGSRS